MTRFIKVPLVLEPSMVTGMQVWDWLQSIMNNIAAAVIVLLIGFILGRVLGRLTLKGLHEAEINRFLKKAKIKFPLEEFVSKAVEYVLYFLAIIMALEQLGLSTYALYLVAAAALAILILAFFLGIKDFIPNFIAGVRLHHKKYFKVGDTITIGTVSGRVKELGLLETKLITRSKDIIHIPNSHLLKHELKVKKK